MYQLSIATSCMKDFRRLVCHNAHILVNMRHAGSWVVGTIVVSVAFPIASEVDLSSTP